MHESIPFTEPFVRVSPKWTWCEYVKTGILSVTLLPMRVCSIISLAFWAWAVVKIGSVGIDLRTHANKPLPRRALLCARIVPFFCRLGAFILGIRVNLKENNANPVRSRLFVPLIVSNHLSYLEILVLLGVYKTSFIARTATLDVPFVGLISEAIQCMYVVSEQGGQGITSVLKERVNRASKYRDVPPLLIFPEGTTTNGSCLARFKTGAFQTAIPIQPLAISFPHCHFNPSWETILLSEHLFRTLTQFVIDIEITELDLYEPTAEEINNPALYAKNVQHEIANALGIPETDCVRGHKLNYHLYLKSKIPFAEAVQRNLALAQKKS
eukprot:Nk52_evm45s914 gene=Nk52_evmTU45s914